MYTGIDGKKFKNFSLKKLAEDSVHLAEVETGPTTNKEGHHINHFKFPVPDLTCLRLTTPTAPLLQMESCELSWMSKGVSSDVTTVLTNVTMQICSNSRIAVVGLNGQGSAILKFHVCKF